VEVPVGGVTYNVYLVRGMMPWTKGRNCDGLCSSNNSAIYVSDVLSASKRIKVFWHELAHAWQFELDIRYEDVQLYGVEPMAELVSIGMGQFDAALIEKVYAFLQGEGVDVPAEVFHE